MNSKGICAITGASGCAGPALVQQLAQAGYMVRVLARHPPSAGLFPSGVEVWAGDILDRSILDSFIRGATYTFHLAAKAHSLSPARSVWDEYRQTNVAGTENVVRASQSFGVKRLIYFSTIGVYGPRYIVDDPIADQKHRLADVDEESAIEPRGIYAETKRRGEEIVLEASDAGAKNHPVTVLRIAAIYGPHMRGNYLRLVQGLSKGMFIPIGSGTNRKTVVHEDDVARAARLVMEDDRAAGKVYNVSDGQIHTVSAIVSAIATALGRRSPRLFVPTNVAKLAARFVDGLMNSVGLSSDYASSVEKLVEDIAVRSGKIQEELGFRPAISLREGWIRTVEEWNAMNI